MIVTRSAKRLIIRICTISGQVSCIKWNVFANYPHTHSCILKSSPKFSVVLNAKRCCANNCITSVTFDIAATKYPTKATYKKERFSFAQFGDPVYEGMEGMVPELKESFHLQSGIREK